MRFFHWQGKLLLLALLALFAVPDSAQADRGRRGRDRNRVIVHADFGRNDYGYRSRDDYRYRNHYRDDDYGWRPGRRVGWRGCDLPPGQAKKYGCYSRANYHSHDRYCGHEPAYYRHYPDRYPRRGRVHGSIVIRIPF